MLCGLCVSVSGVVGCVDVLYDVLNCVCESGEGVDEIY